MVNLDELVERYHPLVVDEMRAVVGDKQDGLYDWMRYHLGWEGIDGLPDEYASTGKLLRPTAVLLATQVVGGTVEKSVSAAAAVELVHNFSLLHDDIEDQSQFRRGRPTLWTLEGVAQGINTGDGMLALARLAMHRLVSVGIDDRLIVEMQRELDEACLRLVEGQYWDILFESRDVVSRDEYVAMASGKTAAMFAAAFAIGALIGDANKSTVNSLRDFGYHLGLAFQAVDDVLGIWGDPIVTGKPVGDDIIARKMTYPIIAALDSEEEGSLDLARDFAIQARADDDVEVLVHLVEHLGGRSATEAFAHDQQRQAIAALESTNLKSEAIAECLEYTRLVIGRSM